MMRAASICEPGVATGGTKMLPAPLTAKDQGAHFACRP